MAIKINVESTVIPVEIGDLKFQIDVSDEHYAVFSKAFDVFLEDMSRLSAEEEEDLALLREKQEKIYNTLLGEGAFESIYRLVPSIAHTTGILKQIVDHLEEEITQRLTGQSIKKIAKPKAPKKK